MTEMNSYNMSLHQEKSHEVLISEENNKDKFAIKKEEEVYDINSPLDKLLDDEDSLVNLSSPSVEDWQKTANSSNASTDDGKSLSEQPDSLTGFAPQGLKDMKEEMTQDPLSGHNANCHPTKPTEKEIETTKTSSESINSHQMEHSHHMLPLRQDTKFKVYQKTTFTFYPAKSHRSSNLSCRQRISTPLGNDQITHTKTNISFPIYHTHVPTEFSRHKNSAKGRHDQQSSLNEHWSALRTFVQFLLGTILTIIAGLGIMALYYVLDALLSHDDN
ncbi:hypothetical protein BD560DRAFT_444842 [Blakeslea trispora]|nr:hypothetical protein BD560DRAFT_444842 [Blakeslea trispora]